jgi:hypothetical protein
MKPGQDMTYWSENHRLLFAAAEYLAGQYWPADLFVSQRNVRKEGAAGAPRATGENREQGEAWNALVALGYKPVEVTAMLKPFAGQGGTTEDIIRRALQGQVRAQ